jgi:hypothetical protein
MPVTKANSRKGGHGQPESNSHTQPLSSVESRQVDLDEGRETSFTETDEESAGERSGEVLDGGEARGRDTPAKGTSSEDFGHSGSFTEESEGDHWACQLVSRPPTWVNLLNGA